MSAYEWMGGLAADVRLAARSLQRGRSASLAAVLTLGLGIGAVTTVFGLVNWIALRPVPGIADPARLVLVQMQEEGGEDETGLSYPNFRDLGDGAPSLRSLAGYAPVGLQAASGGAAPVAVLGEAVAGDYFGTLGLRPSGGRFFSPEERDPEAPVLLAVISHHLWRTRFGSDSAVAGRRLRLNGIDFTVVGIAPPGFRGTERLGTTDVWVPASTYGPLLRDDALRLSDRGPGVLQELVGRLASGATPGLAQEQLRGRMSRLVEAYPQENELYSTYLPTVYEGIGLDVRARGHVRRMLTLMLGVVAIVLLIAWANVGHLLLLRGLRRRGEMAVRRALGASTARLLRSHLVEGGILGLAGGAVGLLLALAGTRLFRGRLIGWLPEVERVGFDARGVAFVLLLSLVSAALFAVIPLGAIRAEAHIQHLRDASRASTGRTSWLRGGLLVAQVASAVVLLVGALLLARTLHALGRVEVGFDAEGVTAFAMDPTELGYTPERTRAFRERLRERVASGPGVESVSLSSGSPFGGLFMVRRLLPAGSPGTPSVAAQEFSVSPEYLATLRIPLLEGRGLHDVGGEGEVVVSRTLARRLFGDADPLGRQVQERAGDAAATPYTVAGVAADTRVHDLRAREPDAVLYRPLSRLEPWRSMTTLLVRSPLPQAAVEARVREAVASLEPSLAVWHTEAVTEAVAGTVREERLLARMAGLLATLAAVLAALGLYAAVEYATAQRTREIGIRKALGAGFGHVVRLVGREALPVVAGGIVLGLAGAMAGSRLLEGRLFGVERLDPGIYGAAAGLLALAAALALWGPLRAARRVDPAEALRQE